MRFGRNDTGDVTRGQRILAAIYFSAATLTTIGLGDWIPRPDSWMRFVVTGESMLGLFLMALFVTMLTRRVVR